MSLLHFVKWVRTCCGDRCLTATLTCCPYTFGPVLPPLILLPGSPNNSICGLVSHIDLGTEVVESMEQLSFLLSELTYILILYISPV